MMICPLLYSFPVHVPHWLPRFQQNQTSLCCVWFVACSTIIGEEIYINTSDMKYSLAISNFKIINIKCTEKCMRTLASI